MGTLVAVYTNRLSVACMQLWEFIKTRGSSLYYSVPKRYTRILEHISEERILKVRYIRSIICAFIDGLSRPCSFRRIPFLVSFVQ